MKANDSAIEPPRLFALRVFRVKEGGSAILRMLSKHYGGLFTHYHRGRSYLCKGEECNPAYHKNDRNWKGYVAAEVWDQAQELYAPVVLEISEHLELDFRRIFKRGQLWEVFRSLDAKKRNSPIFGKLLEDRGEDSCPPAFDVVPCLRTLYHAEHIDLTAKNPLPDRVITTYSKGEAPECLQKKIPETERFNGSAYEEFQKRLNGQRKSPHTNGKH